MNGLKQACEDALVAAWAESDQAMDVCEGDLAVVWIRVDQALAVCEDALVVWVRPREQERPYRSTLPPCSRYDQSIHWPWQVYTHIPCAWPYSTRDGANTNCRYNRSDTSHEKEPPDAERHDDICGLRRPTAHASFHSSVR